MKIKSNVALVTTIHYLYALCIFTATFSLFLLTFILFPLSYDRIYTWTQHIFGPLRFWWRATLEHNVIRGGVPFVISWVDFFYYGYFLNFQAANLNTSINCEEIAETLNCLPGVAWLVKQALIVCWLGVPNYAINILYHNYGDIYIFWRWAVHKKFFFFLTFYFWIF